MMEEDFYATLKLKTGEEIFCKVLPSEEDNKIMLLLSNPVIVSEINARGNKIGYKVEPWLKTTNEDLFIINIDDVLTISESTDIEIIMMYQSFIRKKDTYSSFDKSKPNLTRKMGYISTVDEAKILLEKIYKEL
jgi:hypothetical protein